MIEQSPADSARLGDACYDSGRYPQALAHYREAVRLAPDNARYHYRLAMACWRSGVLEQVQEHLLQTVRLAPRHPIAHEALCHWLLENGDIQGALRHSARAIELAPNNPHALASRAEVLHYAGDGDAAWGLIRPLLEAGQCFPALAILYARMAPRLRQERQAWELLWQVLSATTPGPSVHFAAANLLDRMGRYDEAFAQAAAAHKATGVRIDPASIGPQVDLQLRYFAPPRLARLPRASQLSRKPVFILGMPRSGTSLVEQILAGHPQVHGAGELELMGTLIRAACGPDARDSSAYPECLDSLTTQRCDELAGQYLSHLESLNQTATFVTDKLPVNFARLGLIALLFPGCRVIHCVRDPLDTCVSCYLSDFAFGNEFTHDLVSLGTYYRGYQTLMAHWKHALGLPILDVQYEQVVADLEGQTRRLIEFLGLPFDPRCLSFHESKRYVATLSKQQVRQPIYASSIGRWRNYQKHLGPLMAAIRPEA